MNVGEHYRESLLYWSRIIGFEFPQLDSKLHRVLDDPEATEADYVDLLKEIEKAGGWPNSDSTLASSGKNQMQVSRPSKRVNERVFAMLQKDPSRYEWTAKQWAEALGDCTDAAVKQTQAWKTIITARNLDQADRAMRGK